jgi:hypothetical protein
MSINQDNRILVEDDLDFATNSIGPEREDLRPLVPREMLQHMPGGKRDKIETT